MEAGTLLDISTDLIRGRDRFDYWRHTVMHSMEPTLIPGDAQNFRGRIKTMIGAGATIVDYRSAAVWMTRTESQCRHDANDTISLGLVLGARTGAAQNGREMLLKRGDLYVIDFARPVRSMVAEHHELAIFLPRAAVADALDGEPAALGCTRLPRDGIGALLSAHLSGFAARAGQLTNAERAGAIDAATIMAIATLRAAQQRPVDTDRFGAGIHAAALVAIRAHCRDPEFDPARLAALIRCSRATLYRAFKQQGAGIAATIWSARLDAAARLLGAPGTSNLPVAEAAYRCGFLDPASFSRMFKRRFGVAPSEAREAGIGA